MRNQEGEACLSRLIAAFIEAGSAEGLDTSCVARLRRPAFELPAVAVAKADLERLPGSYVNNEMGYRVKVELVDSRVRLSITQGPPFPPALLEPTSATRFRWEGDGLERETLYPAAGQRVHKNLSEEPPC